MAAATLLLAVAAPAHASTWSEGGASGFAGTQTKLQLLTGSGRSYLALPITALGKPIIDDGLGLAPSSIEPLADDRLLVTDEGDKIVMLDKNGDPEWSYGRADDATLVEPVYASYTKDKTVLIVDRKANLVIEVEYVGGVVTEKWRYSSLYKPYSAEMTSKGHILIADAGNNRVIEVKKEGATGGEIVWQYGKTGKPSSKDGQLKFPTSAQRLDDGHTLITDKNAHRVIEVTSKNKIDWSLGTKDISGSTLTQLRYPTSAVRLDANSVLVADTANQRVLRTGKYGTYAITGYVEPLTARIRPGNRRMVVADPSPNADPIHEYGYSTTAGTYDTGAINLNAPGLYKWVTRLSVTATVPENTKAVLQYSFDGGSWKTAKGLSVKWSGNGRKTSYLRVRVKLDSDDGNATPILKGLTIGYTLATSATPGTSGGTSGFGTTSITGSTMGGTGITGLPGSTGSASTATKSGGAATLLPSGTAVEMQGLNLVHSGYVMDRVSSQMPGAGASVNKPALSVDPVGVVAAGVLLGTFYGLGLAGPQLSHAATSAWGALRQLISGRIHG